MFTRSKHVAISGLHQSGKTTLIASLLNHLFDHDADKFHVGPHDCEILADWTRSKHGRAGQQIFEDVCGRLRSNEWPVKTLNPSTFDLRWRLSSLSPGFWQRFRKSYRWNRLFIHDFPGERFADIDIALEHDYGNWCDTVVSRLANDDILKSYSADFLENYRASTIDSKQSNELIDKLASSYKRFLGSLLADGHCDIAPSSFLIDSTGKYLGEKIDQTSRNINTFAEQGECGLPNKPFAPFPQSLRSTKQGKEMAENYGEYRQKVVLQCIRKLQRCDTLVLLVDVAAVFENGPSWKNTIEHSFNRQIEFVLNRHKLVAMVKDLSGKLTFGKLGTPRLRKILIVGTQIDRLLPPDRDRVIEFLKGFSRRLLRIAQRDRGVKVEYLAIAAIEATSVNEPPNENSLNVFDVRNGIRVCVEESPSRFPDYDGFPNDWERGDYRFPRPKCGLPKTRGNVPGHIDLDLLAAKILGV
jgi:predicted YcjX-like family ATPase